MVAENADSPYMCWDCEKEFNEQGQLHIHKGVCQGHLVEKSAMPKAEEALTYDAGKAPMALVPYEVLELVAHGFGNGAKKYPLWNWRKGMGFLRNASCALRHIGKFLIGQDIDEETGCRHLALAIVRLMFILQWQIDGVGTDDRYTRAK